MIIPLITTTSSTIDTRMHPSDAIRGPHNNVSEHISVMSSLFFLHAPIARSAQRGSTSSVCGCDDTVRYSPFIA